MTDFLDTAHQYWQYVTLLAVVVALVLSFQPRMTETIERVYRLTAVAVDIQVALGIALWLAASGWELGFMQGWLHPIIGLAALGVLHAFVGRARKSHPEVAQRTFRTGIIIALVLVVGAIGIAEMT
jgi:uncharacterized membrane protein